MTDCANQFAAPSKDGTRPKRLLRTKEAAAYLSLSAWKLRSLVTSGDMPVVQADDLSPFLFDVRDLDLWAERHKRRFLN